MNAVKLIIAATFAAVLSGCVVYPLGHRGGGGYQGHHHQHDGYYRR